MRLGIHTCILFLTHVSGLSIPHPYLNGTNENGQEARVQKQLETTQQFHIFMHEELHIQNFMLTRYYPLDCFIGTTTNKYYKERLTNETF